MTTTSLSPSPLASPVGSASPVAPVPTQPSAYPMEWTLADLQERLGGIPAERIHLYPWPGLATENDVLEIHARTGLLCELVDGILVEKPMGFYEVGGEAGMLKILQGRIRIPDVSFIRWDRLPDDRVPVPPVSPDLAVEVLSKSNTEREMQDKLDEYFAGGTRLAWIIDPQSRSARIYHAPDEFTAVDATGSLTGGEVLPGFELKLQDLFAELDRPEN